MGWRWLVVGWMLMGSASLAADDALVVRKAVKEVRLTGYSRSDTELTLSAEVSGKVVAAAYEVGQTVGEDPFCQIDTTFIDLQIEHLRNSRRRLEVSGAKSRSRVTYLAKEFHRIDRLFRENSTAEAKRDAAAEDLEQAELEGEAIAAEQAALDAQIRELAERRKRHEVTAPAGWIVVERRVEPGEVVSPGQALARVADYGTLVVPLAVSGKEYAALQSLPSPFSARLEGQTIRALLFRVNPEFNEKTRKLDVELKILDWNGERRGGLQFTLPVTIETEGLRIPKEAVINRYDDPRVILAESGETVRLLILDEENGDFVAAAKEGLTPGTRLKRP
ncbi:MAG: HlyD family efflux transporter periplasmic adaptor subunit [Desulfobacteraceae bacterium]|nr:HlyD family efflux transporter periplasmic adaptor subunit [Desulfobacteraceae bacterium]